MLEIKSKKFFGTWVVRAPINLNVNLWITPHRQYNGSREGIFSFVYSKT